MKVLVKGPALSMSGYGEQTRFMLDAIRNRQDIDLYLVNISWGKSNLISQDDDRTRWIKSLISKTMMAHQAKKDFQYDMSIQVTIPNEWENIAPINIGYTAGIECDRVSPVWIEKGNAMNKIVTISKHSMDSYKGTKYEIASKSEPDKVIGSFELATPIEYVNYAVRNYEEVDEKLDLNLSTSFNFLTISQFGPRKDLDNLLVSFLEKYKDNPDVGLIVKTHIMNTSIMDKFRLRKTLEPLMKRYKNKKCKVYFLHGELKESEMTSLYQRDDVHAYVTSTHGEGYGLPIFEAVCNAMPVIAPDFSGHVDFLYADVVEKKKVKGKVKTKEKNKALFCRIPHEMKPVQKEAIWKGVIEDGSKWAYCNQSSIASSMEKVRTNYGMYKKWALQLKEHVLENFSKDKMYKQFNDILFGEFTKETPKEIIEKIRSQAQEINSPKERASFLRESIRSFESQKDKLSILKGMFSGNSCYILSCGPTLMDNDQGNLKSILENEVTISIKQSYDLFSELTDFHVYNCGNYKNYEYSESGPIVVEASTTPWKLGSCDLKFLIREREFVNSVSSKKNFSDWTLDKQQLLRPYGPGIMYEIVFYLVEHLGFSEITTVGWDNKLVGNDNSKQHFYDKDNSEFDKSKFIDYNEVAENVNMEQLSVEEKITSDTIVEWYDWLKKSDCTMKICSSINPAPESIERVTI